MASRILESDLGYTEGFYAASFRYSKSIKDLLTHAHAYDYARVLIHAAVERPVEDAVVTTCHVSVSSSSTKTNDRIFLELATS